MRPQENFAGKPNLKSFSWKSPEIFRKHTGFTATGQWVLAAPAFRLGVGDCRIKIRGLKLVGFVFLFSVRTSVLPLALTGWLPGLMAFAFRN
jgi:hypothetical protein